MSWPGRAVDGSVDRWDSTPALQDPDDRLALVLDQPPRSDPPDGEGGGHHDGEARRRPSFGRRRRVRRDADGRLVFRL